ncbi:hypothetical protein LWI28_022042 [Acer negundo]|uniref:Uncharacterized protein n=1 Tax=Acer negundo TaxID=4023 RepID=A0AAD5J655_ACENE|nr:hypothetical protein LWI28_022042 [Acer negundo]
MAVQPGRAKYPDFQSRILLTRNRLMIFRVSGPVVFCPGSGYTRIPGRFGFWANVFGTITTYLLKRHRINGTPPPPPPPCVVEYSWFSWKLHVCIYSLTPLLEETCDYIAGEGGIDSVAHHHSVVGEAAVHEPAHPVARRTLAGHEGSVAQWYTKPRISAAKPRRLHRGEGGIRFRRPITIASSAKQQCTSQPSVARRMLAGHEGSVAQWYTKPRISAAKPRRSPMLDDPQSTTSEENFYMGAFKRRRGSVSLIGLIRNKDRQLTLLVKFSGNQYRIAAFGTKSKLDHHDMEFFNGLLEFDLEYHSIDAGRRMCPGISSILHRYEAYT